MTGQPSKQIYARSWKSRVSCPDFARGSEKSGHSYCPMECSHCGSPQSDKHPLLSRETLRPSKIDRAALLGIRLPVCIRCFNNLQSGRPVSGEPGCDTIWFRIRSLWDLSQSAARLPLSDLRALVDEVDAVQASLEAEWLSIQKRVDRADLRDLKAKRVSGLSIAREIQVLNRVSGKIYDTLKVLSAFVSVRYSEDRKEAALALKRKVTREHVFRKFRCSCAMCGASEHLSIDHIIPVARGGSNDPDNLQLLCRTCNSQKGAKT